MHGDSVLGNVFWNCSVLKLERRTMEGENPQNRGEVGKMPFYVVVLLWRLFGRGAQGSVCLNFSLSLRTGTLISIGPGPHPRKGGSTFKPLLEKKKERGSKRGRRIAMAQQEMLTANLIYMQVQGEWGGGLIPFPISMLNAGQGSWWEWEALFAPCCSFLLHYTNTCLAFFSV